MRMAGDKLRKVTLNLYDADVEWLQKYYGHGYSEAIRHYIHREVNHLKQLKKEREYGQ